MGSYLSTEPHRGITFENLNNIADLLPVNNKIEEDEKIMLSIVIEKNRRLNLEKKDPIDCLRVDHRLAIIQPNEIVQQLQQAIGNDNLNCQCVYTRQAIHTSEFSYDIEEIVGLQYFYDLKQEYTHEQIKARMIQKSNLINNPSVLVDAINNNLKVCISFGVMDYFYEKIDNIIVRTSINYPMEN